MDLLLLLKGRCWILSPPPLDFSPRRFPFLLASLFLLGFALRDSVAFLLSTFLVAIVLFCLKILFIQEKDCPVQLGYKCCGSYLLTRPFPFRSSRFLSFFFLANFSSLPKSILAYLEAHLPVIPSVVLPLFLRIAVHIR